MTGAERIYRLLLGACPAAFRRRFAAEMAQTFADRYRAAAARGPGAAAWLCLRAFTNILATAAALRLASWRDRLLWPDPLAVPDREWRTKMWWHLVIADVRFALRMFGRNPLFALLATSALALGIGASTAIFTIVNGVLLRPLPYGQPDQLVMVWSTQAREHRDRDAVSPLDFLDFRKASSFSSLEAAYGFVVATSLAAPGGGEQIVVTAVTPGLFAALDRAPVMGRPFSTADGPSAVMLSWNFWRSRLGSDPSVIGRVLNIDSQPRTVVGVMPRDFVFPYGTMLGPSGFARAQAVDAWLPLGFVPGNTRQTGAAPLARDVRLLSVVGRLAPGVTVAQADAEVRGIARAISISQPTTNNGVGAAVVSMHEQTIGSTRPALLVLLGGVGLVLLMACLNLANMLLARSSARQKEMAVRAALGAGRARLITQLLVESVLLGAGAGLIALGGVWVSFGAIIAAAPSDIPRIGEVHPDWRVLLFAAVISMVSGMLVGLLPAVAASRSAASAGLRHSGRGTTSSRAQRKARAALVMLQAALAVVLTSGAGLLLRSFVSLAGVDPGFQAPHLLTLQISVPPKYQTADQRRVLYASLASHFSGIPSVTAIGGTTRLPLGSTSVSTKIAVDGRSLPPSQWPEVEFRRAIFDYFKAMAIPVVRGRGFNDADGPRAPSVCVINETMARRVFPGEDAVGQRIRFGSADGPPTTIVGVIGDVRHAALDAVPAPEVYVYYLQNPPVNPFLVVRTTSDPIAIVPEVRAQLAAVDPAISSNDIRPMSAVLSASLAQRRFVLLLAAAFGTLALIMSAAGVYGVMALVVSERIPEIAVRLALGAAPGGVLGLVLRQGVLIAAAGAAIGVCASVAMAPILGSQLYGVRPGDPLTLTAVPLLVLAVAACACLLPAYRTTRIDPVRALRAD